MKNVLTIAGSDSCGGAGIQADLKTFCANGTYGMSVITAITAQNTTGVFAIQDIDVDIVKAQIDAIFTDIEVGAVKIGMVSVSDTINAIADKLTEYNFKNIILDPVMISKSGFNLLNPNAKATLIKRLIPLALVITPNIPEAEAITSMSIKNIDDMKKAAELIYSMGAKYVLVKGGHLEDDATDILFDGKEFTMYPMGRIDTKNTHGTGCTFSSAIAANIAKGQNVKEAVKNAKEYITEAILHSIELGKGVGPTNHFYSLYKKAGLDVQ